MNGDNIADTTFSNNSTGLRGGALLMANGNGTITNSLFTGNSAGGDGKDNLATGTASGGHADGDILVNIENLIGSRFDDSLTGNALANVLSGGGGDDRLNGGAGHDTLTGGLGSDTFVLTRLAASSDTITDFEVGVDTLEISASTGGLAADTLDPARFAFNAAGTAGDLDDRFVYNTTTGELIFDRNGSDPGGNTVIAILQGIPTFTAGDILIV